MFRKSLFRTTRLCWWGMCSTPTGTRQTYVHPEQWLHHFRELCFERLSWLSLNWAFQILPDSSLSFNFSHSFYEDFIKYLKTQQTSANSCFQVCTVAMFHFRKSPGRMAVEKSITSSACGPQRGETINWNQREIDAQELMILNRHLLH